MAGGGRWMLLAAVLQGAALGWAENAPPAATPQAGIGAGAGTGAVETLKANAQLVVLDVVVTDAHQAPVIGLQASDFKVEENGATQQVTNFEEHVAMAADAGAKMEPAPELPAGIFSNYTPAPPDSAVNVLVFDCLNTQMRDQARVRDQLLEFVKKTPEGARIAVFGLNNRLVLLQGFTSDPAVLRSAIAGMALSPSALLGDPVGDSGSDPVVDSGGTKASRMVAAASGPDMAQVVASMRKAEGVQSADDLQTREDVTLGAMGQLARYLGGIPGRKNVIWFSDTYPFNLTPKSANEYRETINLLARNRVAVYPVAAGGLYAYGADRRGTLAQAHASQNMAVDQIAADTGGVAYTEANGLSEAAGKAIENGANYYTLSYTPTDARPNGEFRKIEVKMARPGLELTYRNGYYADEPGPKVKGAEALAAASGRPNALTAAMLRGAPDATEILLKAQVLPVSEDTERDAAKGNMVNPIAAAKVKIKGPYRRYAIDIAADAKDIRITPTADGHYAFSAELVTYVYDAGGVVVNLVDQKVQGNLTVSIYANMQRVGVPFHQEISVPAVGEYYLRTSLHDLETDRYGSVEIPVASVAKLAPMTAAVRAR